MKIGIKKNIVIFLSFLLMISICAGCGGEAQQETVQESTTAPQTEPESHFTGVKTSPAAEKEETVLVKADASGFPSKVTVSSTLKKTGDSEYVSDRSDLSDIVNTEGDEEFQQKGEELIWENKGADITYEGISAKEPPVGVQVTFYLDDKEISPQKLAGKSGKVRIRFDYSNNEPKKTRHAYAFMTVLFLDRERFTGIEIKNGTSSVMGDLELVIGYALPGLKKAMGLSKLDDKDELDFPEYLEITADVTDFKLDYTTTIVTSGLFENIKTSSLKRNEDLVAGLKELQVSSSDILAGVKELNEGADQFQDALKQFTDGASQIGSAVGSLSEGASKLIENGSGLRDGSTQLSDGLNQLGKQLSSVNTDELKGIDDELEKLRPEIEALRNTDFGMIKNVLDSVLDFCEDVRNFLNSVSESNETVLNNLRNVRSELQGMRSAISAMKLQGVDTSSVDGYLNNAMDELQETILNLTLFNPPEISFDISGLKNNVSEWTEALEHVDDLLEPLRDLPELSELIGQMDELKAGVEKLSQGAEKLDDGIKQYMNGAEQLKSGADQLKDGSEKFNGSTDELNTGFGSLAEGIDKLLEGYQIFDGEGMKKLDVMTDGNLENVFKKIRKLKKLDENSESFSGCAEGTASNVKYVIETAGV